MGDIEALVAEFNSLLSKDPTAVVGLANDILAKYRKLSPSDQWSEALSGVVAEEFAITFKKNEDEGSLFLVPEEWDSAPQWAKSRAGREGALVNPALLPRNLINAVRFADPGKWRSSRSIGMLKHYYNYGLKVGKPEPVVALGPSMSLNDGIDTLSGVRVHICLMAHWMFINAKVSEELVVQTAKVMFSDPYAETAFLKKNLSPLKHLIFARAKRGEVIRWAPMTSKDDPLEKFIVKDISDCSGVFQGSSFPFNDEQYYLYLEKEVNDALLELRRRGYTLLADRFEYLLSPEVEVTHELMAETMFLNYIGGLSGFTRGDQVASYKNQIKKEGVVPANPGYIPELERHINEFVSWAHENGKFPTSDEWKARLAGSLNSNSAGGPVAVYEYMLDGIKKQMKASDKTLVFMSDPQKFLSKEMFDKAMTFLEPGRVAGRDVTEGKNTRAVWMIHLTVYLYETAWAYALIDWLNQHDRCAGGEIGMDAHKFFIYATSVASIILTLKDFSGYDTTQEPANARGPLTKAMVNALNDKGYMQQIGELGSLPEVYKLVNDKLSQAWFDLGDGTLVSPKQEHSGELNTYGNNTALHLAEDDYEERVIDATPTREKIGPRLVQSILGDDNAKAYDVLVRLMSTDYADWMALCERAAFECGFKLNGLKTTSRSAYGEFLKVLYLYGHQIPALGRLMPFSSERTNVVSDPIEIMRGLCSFYRTIVARGGDHKFCLNFVHHVWNVRRGVRKRFFKSKKEKLDLKAEVEYQDYPYACMWLPMGLGGIGELPFTLMAASKDAVIYVWAKAFKYIDVLNHAAHVLDYPKIDANKVVADQLKDQVKPFNDWLHTTNDDKTKRLAAYEARQQMPFLHVGELGYDYSVDRRVARTLRGASKVNELAAKIKERMSLKMAEREKLPVTKDYMKNLFGWLDYVNFSFDLEVQDAQLTNAIVGRDESVARFERFFGFSTVTNDQRSRISKLFKVMGDNTFNPEAEFGFETLVGLFTRPDVFGYVDRITNVAIQIGAQPNKAAQFANMLMGSLNTVLILDRGQRFSSGDELCSVLNLSYTRLAEVVQVSALVTDSTIQYLLRQVATMLILTTPPSQPLYGVTVLGTGSLEAQIMHFLNPSKNPEFKAFLSGYPMNTMY
jgi:hypothetical protein